MSTYLPFYSQKRMPLKDTQVDDFSLWNYWFQVLKWFWLFFMHWFSLSTRNTYFYWIKTFFFFYKFTILCFVYANVRVMYQNTAFLLEFIELVLFALGHVRIDFLHRSNRLASMHIHRLHFSRIHFDDSLDFNIGFTFLILYFCSLCSTKPQITDGITNDIFAK